MRSFKMMPVIGLALTLFSARAVFADITTDAMSIIINEQTGQGYYQLTIGSNTSSWKPLADVVQSTWDSMTVTHGGSPVGTTEDFELANISYLVGGTDYTIIDTTGTSWRNNRAAYVGGTFSGGVYSGGTYTNPGDTEAALIVTKGGTSSTSAVSNLVVFDNAGQSSSGILVYNAPGASPEADAADYGFTNGTYSATGNGIPITELGSDGSSSEKGLEGDLENYSTFAGPGSNGENIAVGEGDTVIDPMTGKLYYGYKLGADSEANVANNPTLLTAGTDPAQLFIYANGAFSAYISPTVYFESFAVPLPAPFWYCLSLMVLMGFAKFRTSRRIRI